MLRIFAGKSKPAALPQMKAIRVLNGLIPQPRRPMVPVSSSFRGVFHDR
jgi:hypothetical protein